MKRTTIATLFLVGLASVFTVIVSADNPQFKSAPTAVDNGTTATSTGRITGLGNGDVRIFLEYPDATATTTCSTRGGNEAPGQNPALPVEASGFQFINDPKNGNLTFRVTTLQPENPSPAEAGCPNANWRASINDVTFGCGTLTVQQETFQGSGVYQTVLTTTVCAQ